MGLMKYLLELIYNELQFLVILVSCILILILVYSITNGRFDLQILVVSYEAHSLSVVTYVYVSSDEGWFYKTHPHRLTNIL